MASRFVLTAQVQLQAPTNARQVVNQIQQQLKGVNVQVNLQGGQQAAKQVNNLGKATQQATTQAQKMGKAFGASIRRFGAFTIATRAISLFTSGLANATREAIDFEREMIKISQVTGNTLGQLKGLENTITELATSLGVSSKSILSVGRILSQAGIQARDLEVALKTLAKTELAPTFDDITQTAEGAVAVLAQFGEGVGALERQLGAINRVAGQFAVEAGDLISVVRRTGGVFKAAGGDLEELIALFTSVRATTRESAESIATGLRTIFTRIQRPKTIEFLKQFGVQLTDLNGKFVGPYEAIRQLSDALSGLEQGDIRFVRIAEELGGFRQIGKVIPLLQQFETAERARQAALEGGNSLNEDAATAQAALAVQISKVKEEFLALIRSFTQTGSFQTFVKSSLELASALIKIADAIKPLIPLLTAFAAVSFARGAAGFARGIGAGLRGAGRPTGFATGGMVPGVGNRDTVPAMLTPGEFVIRKSSVSKLGAGTLAAMNQNGYAAGGIVTVDRHGYGEFTNNSAAMKAAKRRFTPSEWKSKSADEKQKLAAASAIEKQPTTKGNEQRPDQLITSGRLGKRFGVSFLRGSVDKIDSTINAVRKESNATGRKVLDKSILLAAQKKNPDEKIKSPAEAYKFVARGAPITTIGTPTFLQPSGKKIFEDEIIDGVPKLFNKAVKAFKGTELDPKNVPLNQLVSKSAIGSLEGNFFEAFVRRITNNVIKDPTKDEIFDFTSLKSDDLNKLFGKKPFVLPNEFKNDASSSANIASAIGKALTLGKAPVFANKGGGISGSDTVPAMLTPGEFVFNKSAAKSIGYSNLNRMNKQGVKGYAAGGVVTSGRHNYGIMPVRERLPMESVGFKGQSTQQRSVSGSAPTIKANAVSTVNPMRPSTSSMNSTFGGAPSSYPTSFKPSTVEKQRSTLGVAGVKAPAAQTGFKKDNAKELLKSAEQRIKTEKELNEGNKKGTKIFKTFTQTVSSAKAKLEKFASTPAASQQKLGGTLPGAQVPLNNAGVGNIKSAVGGRISAITRGAVGAGLAGAGAVAKGGRAVARGGAAVVKSGFGAVPAVKAVQKGFTSLTNKAYNLIRVKSAEEKEAMKSAKADRKKAMAAEKAAAADNKKAAKAGGGGGGGGRDAMGGLFAISMLASLIPDSKETEGFGAAVNEAKTLAVTLGTVGFALSAFGFNLQKSAVLGQGFKGGGKALAGNFAKFAGVAAIAAFATNGLAKVMDAYTGVKQKAKDAEEEAIKTGSAADIAKAEEAAASAANADAMNKVAAGAAIAGATIGMAFGPVGAVVGGVVGGLVGLGLKFADTQGKLGEFLKPFKDFMVSIGLAPSASQVKAQTAYTIASARAQKELAESAKDAAEELKDIEAGKLSATASLGAGGAAARGAKALNAQREAGDRLIRENQRSLDAVQSTGLGRFVSKLTGREAKDKAEQKRIEKEQIKSGQDFIASQSGRFAAATKEQVTTAAATGGSASFEQFLGALDPSIRAVIENTDRMNGNSDEMDKLRKNFENQKKAVMDNIKFIKAMNFGLSEVTSGITAYTSSLNNLTAAQETGFSTAGYAAETLATAISSAGKFISSSQLGQSLNALESNLKKFGANADQISGARELITGLNDLQKSAADALLAVKAGFKGGSTSPEAIKNELRDAILGSIPDSSPIKQKLIDSFGKLELPPEAIQEFLNTGDVSVILDKAFGPIQEQVQKQLIGPLQEMAKQEQILVGLTKQRREAEKKLIDVQKTAIDTQIEAAKSFEEFGGAKFTPEREFDARRQQTNLVLRDAGVQGLASGSVDDIRAARDQIFNNFSRQQQLQNAAAAGGGGAFGGVEGIDRDRREELKTANQELINFTKQGIEARKKELELINKKNAAEKQALDSLLTGDIESFFDQAIGAAAGSALRTGNAQVASLFGAGALGKGLQGIQDTGLSDAENQRAASIAFGAFGLGGDAASLYTGTTREEEQIKAQGRELALMQGELASQSAEMEEMTVQAKEVVISAANVRLTEIGQQVSSAQAALNFSRGGAVYASRGMFIPRGTDTVPAMLTPGEFVVNRAAVQRGNNLQILRSMNSNSAPIQAAQGFSSGGPVRYRAAGSTGPELGGGMDFSKFEELVNKFQEVTDKLGNVNIKHMFEKLGTLDINHMFNGNMQQALKDEILAEAGNMMSRSKFNNDGSITTSDRSVLG